MSIRAAFLKTADQTAHLLRGSAVASHWDHESPLADMSVGALAAHLARAVLTTEQYLRSDPPESSADLVGTADYFLRAFETDDVDALNAGILQRARDAAEGGAGALAADIDGALHRLRPLLADAPADRRVAVFGGLAMELDDYLGTRLVELVVHMDDLASGVGQDEIEVPEEAATMVVGTLAEIARRRSSTSAVVRQLARRERAPEGGVYAF